MRPVILLSVLLVWLGNAVPAGAAADGSGAKVLAGLPVEFTTRDGWLIKAKYLPAREGLYTFLLLHERGRWKESWHLLGRKLQEAGYGYLALDFRGHGHSNVTPEGQTVSWRDFKITKTYNEFANMTAEVDAAVAYLGEQGVPRERIGIIGAQVGSSIGLKYAAVHPEVPLVVMLSPGLRYREVLTVNAMRRYKDRPILMIHSESDKYSTRDIGLLGAIARNVTGDLNTSILTVPKHRGTRMLDRKLVDQIVDWVAAPVKVPEDELSPEERAEAGMDDGAGMPAPAPDAAADAPDQAPPDEASSGRVPLQDAGRGRLPPPDAFADPR